MEHLQGIAEGDDTFDITNGHLHSLADIRIPPHVKYVDLTANRLKAIEPSILELQHVEQISFRQNLLHDASDVNQMKSAPKLKRLELRDNLLQEVPVLDQCQCLTYLELSYNELRDASPLTEMKSPYIEELYLANNKLTRIVGIEHMRSLRILELGSNRIREMEGLCCLTGLEELWLGSNRIQEIRNLEEMGRLKRLSLQSNRLTSMVGLHGCHALEELYVSDNGLTIMEGLEHFPRLKILDVSYNRISALHGLEHLTEITDVWANDNVIEDLEEVEKEVGKVKETLRVLYLHGNPCARVPQYRLRLLHTLPELEQLDDAPVGK